MHTLYYNYKLYIPKLRQFASDIGYKNFENWAENIQTVEKSKTFIVIFGYAIILVISSLIFDSESTILIALQLNILFLILGLIYPKIVLWWCGEQTRLQALKIFGLLICISLIVAGFSDI